MKLPDFCEQIVAYGRTRMIGNEAQCLALTLSMATAFAPSPREFASVGIWGELASGKTHCANVILGENAEGKTGPATILGIFPHDVIHRVTSASSKAMIYSEALREPEFGERDSKIKIILATEYQKLDDEIIEYLKAQSGDDPVFVYEFTDMTIKSTRRIKQKKRVFVFTYAQVEMDMELESRIIRFTVEENKKLNKCVNKLTHGARYADYKGFRYTLQGDQALEAELRNQIDIIAGGQPIEVVNPFFDALEDLEDCSRASSKRVAKMIEALFKSSARLNFDQRKIDENGAVVMSVQDIVNVLSLTDIIQSLVIEIDTVDLAIVRFLGMRGKAADANRIITAVSKSGLMELTKKEFNRRIDRLINLNYVYPWEPEDMAGNKKKEVWYRLNRDKYIHPITVNWVKAHNVDDRPVINPITGVRYSSIIEFGREFDEIIRRGIETNAKEYDPDYEPTFEETVLMTVQKLITSGKRYKAGDFNELRRDAMVQLGQLTIGDHEKFALAMDELFKAGLLDIDPGTQTYILLDPSLKRNVLKNVNAVTHSILEG